MKNKMVIIITVVIVLMFVMISFSNFIYHNNTDIKNNPEVSENNIKKDSAYGHYYWGLGNPIKTIKLWTPIILLNSPYKGCAEASSGQGFKVKYDIAGFSSCTATSSGQCLSGIKNGEAVALVQLDGWTIYPVVLKWSSSGGGCPGPKPANYVAEITDNNGVEKPYCLIPPGTKSDCYEPGEFTYDGYNSVFFCNGFNPNSWNTNSPNFELESGAAGCLSFTTIYEHEEKASFGINVVISGVTCFLSGTLTLTATSGSWCWGTFSYHYNSFTYKVPTNSGGAYEFEALNTGDTHDMSYAIRWIKC